MKLISCNVNGFRAALTNGFEAFFNEIDAVIHDNVLGSDYCPVELILKESQARLESNENT